MFSVLIPAVLLALAGCDESGDSRERGSESGGDASGVEMGGSGDANGVETGGSGGNPADDLGPGPTITCASPPGASQAALNEGAAQAKELIDVLVYEGGALHSFDGLPCEPDPTSDRSFSMGCWENYLCGSCPITFIEREWGSGFNNPMDFDGGCAEYAGLYELIHCDPACGTGEFCHPLGFCSRGSGNACSSDGECPSGEYCATAIGRCGLDLCDACIQDCYDDGSGNCCTCGDGCFCADECFSICP